MPDHPATDPAKPGSKLASMQALGRRGGLRQTEEEQTPISVSKVQPKKLGKAVSREGTPSPVTVKSPPRKRATKAKVKTVKKAKAVLKRAEASARSKLKKPGPPIQVGEPWVELGISKATYHRRRKAGEL